MCLLFFSCSSVPEVSEPVDTQEPGLVTEEREPEPDLVEEVPEEEEPVEEEEHFDPASITKEVFDSTKNDVQILIESLNDIIRRKDFYAWVDYLGDSYIEAVSSPDFLARISESARLRSQNIVLRDLKDYFIYVVVPARANDRVDDIEFIGQNRVKAYTVTADGKRLRLYDLERTGHGWKIVN